MGAASLLTSAALGVDLQVMGNPMDPITYPLAVSGENSRFYFEPEEGHHQ